jgi:hypothetical protein
MKSPFPHIADRHRDDVPAPDMPTRHFGNSLLFHRRVLRMCAAGFTMALLAGGEENDFRLSVAPSNAPVFAALDLPLNLPADASVYLRPPTGGWVRLGAMEFDIVWPANGPTNTQVLVHLMDWDWRWYQAMQPGYLMPGKTQRFRVDLMPGANNWEPKGHHVPWQLRTLCDPVQAAIRIFGPGPYRGTCRVDRVTGRLRPESRGPPPIRGVRASAAQVPCYEKFELTFSLPDRYPNPFDPDQVRATATFEGPTGQVITVDGFYAQDYYRTLGPTGERTEPQGMPQWKARFAPTAPGRYRYRLTVKDSEGVARWEGGQFDATSPRQPGYVRASRRDPRHFEFDDGSYFFPIGHNIRSPFDVRTDQQFPWKQRWSEGSAAYLRYFRELSRNGANFVEIWAAAWSLGLEWNPIWEGYHGIGQYNLRNAWEMDQVVDSADRLGIYINLVVLNHGRFAEKSDQEWAFNPLNVQAGGYLKETNEFFTNPRALRDFQNMMRYMIARWGYSTRIFAWQLWSELNLAGTGGVYRKPECVEWHRIAAEMIKTMDPNDHLIATHYSGDYHTQNLDLSRLPSLTHCALDAYHSDKRALHIVTVMGKTADYNNPLGKPVLITEFGGNFAAQQGYKHISDAHHAAIWASTCIPIAGTPCYWWWMIADEENFYPRYGAVSRFMKGEDRRGPDKRFITTYAWWTNSVRSGCAIVMQGGESTNTLAALAYGTPESLLGWICRDSDFDTADPDGLPGITNAVVELSGVQKGTYTASFWDTKRGRPMFETDATSRNGVLRIAAPPFGRDIAFKVKKAD